MNTVTARNAEPVDWLTGYPRLLQWASLTGEFDPGALRALDRLKAAGNSLFVVEHELDVIRHADWIVDVGPAAGEQGGCILYSGPPDGLRKVPESTTRRYLFAEDPAAGRPPRPPRSPPHR